MERRAEERACGSVAHAAHTAGAAAVDTTEVAAVGRRLRAEARELRSG